MKRIMMTGPTGAIGIALIRQCICEGVEVYALCRRHSERIGRIPVHTGVHVIECDLDKLGDLDTGRLPRFDAFYHLGWEGTTGASRNNMQLQLGNVRYTLDAVKVAQELGCEVFVGVGSQAEYGRVEGKLCPATPVFPENGYGVAKLCAGQMSRMECRQRGVRHIWARVLSVYGPCDNEASMIVHAARMILAGQTPLFTKGEQQWDYLYSEDAARALYLLGESGIDGKVYCVGSGRTKRLEEYIRILGREVDPAIPLGIGAIPYAEDQVMYLCADIEELQRDTGFCPRVDFAEGIRNTVRWLKEEECAKNR